MDQVVVIPPSTSATADEITVTTDTVTVTGAEHTGPIAVVDAPPPPPPYVPSGPDGPAVTGTIGEVAQLPPQRPRVIGVRPADDWIALAASMLGGLGLVWVLYEKVLPLSGNVGFVLCWYLCFLGIYAAISATAHPRPVVVDRVAAAVVHGGAFLVGAALFISVFYPFAKGWSALHHLNFFTHDMSGVRPTAPLTQGGILHAIVGSLIQVGIAACVALPLGVGTAVFMNEVGGPLARIVRAVVEAMTALPDILAGLFIYATLILKLGVEKSGFAAAMALTVMMLPIIARSADVSLRVVPGGLREAGLALGASRWKTVWQVVIPTARAGLATALILGIARAVGETAPVLITSAAATTFNAKPLQDPMNSLPLYIYSAVRSGQPLFIARGFAAAAVLLTIVLLLFMVVRFLARAPKGSR